MKGVSKICTFVLLVLSSLCSADPNFKNIFKQTVKEAKNEALNDIVGKVPDWITGDFVRQNCASFGNIDGKQKIQFTIMTKCNKGRVVLTKITFCFSPLCVPNSKIVVIKRLVLRLPGK